MMTLGYVSAILPDEPLERIFAIAKACGYDCVELMCWPPGKANRRYAGVTHIDVCTLDENSAEEILALSDRYGIGISGLGYYPNPLSANAEEAATAVDHLKMIIERVSLLNIDRVNTFIGRNPVLSVDDNWPRFLETWRPLIQHAEQHGVNVGIENCPMLFGPDEWPGGTNLAFNPAIWRRMFNDIPSPNFGLNYDPSHLVWMQMDYCAPLREFTDRIFHVHAKDYRVDQHRLNDVGILAYPPEYYTPKIPGLGDIDWGKFLSVLGDVGFRGAVCVEVEDRAYEHSTEARILSLQQSAKYLRNFIPDRLAVDPAS